MHSFPRPALASALAGVAALPFSVAVASTLLLTAALGAIIRLDYGPRRMWHRRSFVAPSTSRTRPPLRCERNQLAA